MLQGMEALRAARRILKTQTRMADIVGVKPQSVSEMLASGKRVPAEWCIPLEEATAAAGEKISRGQFRPDLWPEDFAKVSSGVTAAHHRERDADTHAPKRAGAGAR